MTPVFLSEHPPHGPGSIACAVVFAPTQHQPKEAPLALRTVGPQRRLHAATHTNYWNLALPNPEHAPSHQQLLCCSPAGKPFPPLLDCPFVCLCLPLSAFVCLFSFVCPCLPLFALVCIYFPLFAFVCLCLPLFAFVCLCLPLLAIVCLCWPSFAFVCLRLPLFG